MENNNLFNGIKINLESINTYKNMKDTILPTTVREIVIEYKTVLEKMAKDIIKDTEINCNRAEEWFDKQIRTQSYRGQRPFITDEFINYIRKNAIENINREAESEYNSILCRIMELEQFLHSNEFK